MSAEASTFQAAASLQRLHLLIDRTLGVESASAAFEAGETVALPETRMMSRLKHQETCRQANIEKIIYLASQELISVAEDSAPERSWLVRFFDFAQDVNNEGEQHIWARILGQEMAAAGSVGKRTLAFLSAMELWELEGFIEYAAFSFAFESGWRFMFAEESARREIWTYGRELDLTHHFINIGLLEEGVTQLNPATVRGLRIRYCDRIFELGGNENSNTLPGGGECGVNYRKFTVIGQQLFHAIRPKVYFGYARNVIKVLSSECGTHFELLESTPT